MKQLWVEQYRPKDIEGYVFRDEAQRDQVKQWIKAGSIPHLLFSGAAGIGKTTLAKILINALNIDEYDVLEINASRTNSVDDIRDSVVNFVSTMPFGNFKIVLLDEADYLSPNGMVLTKFTTLSLISSTELVRDALISNTSYSSMFRALIKILASVVLPMPAAPENNKCGILPALIHCLT